MQYEDRGKVTKIVVIVAIILAVISLVLPWRGLSASYSMGSMGSYSTGFNFYPWGSHFELSFSMPSSTAYPTSSISSYNVWSIFYAINTGTNIEALSNSSSTGPSYNDMMNDPGAAAAMDISFVFCIITILLGILSIKRFKMCLMAGFSAVIAIIAFIIGISIIFSKDPTGAVSSAIPYTIGFYIMILSLALFFVAFGLKYEIATMSRGIYQAYGNQQTSGYNYPPKEGFESKPNYPYYSNEKRRCPECGVVIEGNPDACINCGKKLM